MEICKQQRELEISSMQIVGVTQRYASSKARLKCATEQRDYQIPVTQLKGPKGLDMQAAKRD